jgi:formate/nitrite transporter FocA (FNT family)
VNLTGMGAWLGSGAAIVVIGACSLITIHMHHLPPRSHPWIARLVIAAMYCAGCTLVITAAGEYVTGLERDVTGWFGGVATGIGWAAITVAVLFLLAAIMVALIWEPAPGFGYYALATPFVAVLAAGGLAAQAYQATAVPAQQGAEALARILGG